MRNIVKLSELTIIGIAVLSLILGLVLDIVKFEIIIFASVLFIVIYLINMFLLSLISHKKELSDFNKNLKILHTIIKGVITSSPILLSVNDIKNLEKECKEEVWVATLDLQHDLGPFKEVVVNNIKRGVHYRYILPQNDINRASTNQLIRTCESYKNNISFCFTEHFPFITETVVYDPSSEKTTGYIVLPISNSIEKRFILIVDKNEMRRIRGVIYKYVKEEG